MRKPKKPTPAKEKDPLKLIESLYRDVYQTNDKVILIESQQKEIIHLLSQLLKIHKDYAELEQRIFNDIRSKELRNP